MRNKAWILPAIVIMISLLPGLILIPGRATADNVTLVEFTNTANVSILSGNVSVTADENTVDEVEQAVADNIDKIFYMCLEPLIILAINYFGYKFQDRWLCVIGGIALMLYSFTLWDRWMYISLFLFLVGIYNLGKAKWDKDTWSRKR